MKPYLPILVAAACVLVVFAVVYFTAEALQSPQVRLYRQIEEQIEEAQRMLDAYEPAGERLLTAVGPAATQPVDLLPEDQWDEHLNYGPFEDSIQKRASRLQSLTRQFIRLGGETRSKRGLPAPELKRDLEENQKLVDSALAIVRKAVRMSRGTGAGAVSGTSHPAATRLEAILLYHKADLLRRRAALSRAMADTERTRLSRLRGSWREVETIVSTLEPDRAEGQPAEPAKPEAPGSEETLKPTAARTDTAARAPAAGARRRGLLGTLSSWVFGRKDGGPEAPAEHTPPGVVEDTTSAAPTVPDRPTPADSGAIGSASAPTLAKRLADLHGQRETTTSQIKDAQAEVARLRDEVSALEQELAAAQSAAAEAQQRMFRLEEADTDPTDPEALDRFIAEYRAASKAHREASRQVAILESGAVRNARPDADDEREIPAAPLVAVDTSRAKEPRRGLVALRPELNAARGRVEALEAVLSTIGDQASEIRKRQEGVAQWCSQLRALQAGWREEAAQAARAVIAVVLEAEQLETEAVQVLTVDGKRAAGNAKRAAEKRITDARSVKREHPDASNPRLDLITKGQFIVGHAQTIEADLEYLRAQILAQRAAGLQRHHRMLREADEMGIRDETQLVPEVPAGRTVPDYCFRSEAARTAAEEARENAINAANAALELYDEADDDLKRLWVLHANMAVVNYLLANLHPEPEAQQYRDEAIRMYEQAIQDRDPNDTELYQRIIEGLTQVAP